MLRREWLGARGGDTAQHEDLRVSCAQVIETVPVVAATVEGLVFIVFIDLIVVIDGLARREMSVVNLNRRPPASQVSTRAVLCRAWYLLGGDRSKQRVSSVFGTVRCAGRRAATIDTTVDVVVVATFGAVGAATSELIDLFVIFICNFLRIFCPRLEV